MSSCVLESLWREGLSMDSSIFSDDDDCVDWRWPASSPRRCDRERRVFDMEYPAAHQTIPPGSTSSCSCSSSSSSSSSRSSHGSLDENFFYCTEELGSESTCGSVDFSDKGASSSCSTPNISVQSSLHTSADSFAPHHLHHHQYYSAAFRHGRHGCTFPPPISSLLTDRPLMQSFKSHGRFILKKVAIVSCSLFRATRSNGCLRLDLLPPSPDCVESQQGLFSPGNEDTDSSSPSDDFHHNLKYNVPPYHLLSSPSPYSIFLQQRKPILNYAALCLLSKLQAFAMLVNPSGACCSVVEKSDTAWEAGRHRLMKKKACAGMSAAMVDRSRLRVFALLRVLPGGLGLIIFEVGGGKSDGGAHIRVHGMCIMETSSGAECGGAGMPAMPSHSHLIPSISGNMGD